MRISNVQDVSAQVKALVNDVMYINENVTNNPGYYKNDDKMNPLYEVYGYTYLDKETSYHKYYVPTEELVKFMRETNNPLLRVYADPRANMGNDEDGRANYDLFGLENERYIGVPYGMIRAMIRASRYRNAQVYLIRYFCKCYNSVYVLHDCLVF